MKRMYLTLGILFLVAFWAFSCLGQKKAPDITFDREQYRTQRRMELREEMHKRMRDKLLHGVGPDQDLFKDMEQMFEDSMADAFSGFDTLAPATSNFQMDWTETAQGRTLLITPKNKDQQLDIDVKPETVTIKGKNEVKSPNGVSVANFSNTFSVPEDCDGSKVKIDQKDGKIVMHFPYRSLKNIPSPIPKVEIPKKDLRKPIPPSEDEITI